MYIMIQMALLAPILVINVCNSHRSLRVNVGDIDNTDRGSMLWTLETMQSITHRPCTRSQCSV